MAAQDNLINAVKTGDIDSSVEITKKLLSEGVSADEILNTVTGAMREVGDAFDKFEIFLPEMMLAADTMNHGIRKGRHARDREEYRYNHVQRKRL
jgi:trimethylamine corrinoid protein